MEILEQRDNQVMGRTEVRIRIEYSGATPDRSKLKEQLSKDFDIDEEGVIIHSIKPQFGESSAILTANLYKETKHIPEIEQGHAIKKNNKGAEEPEEPSEEEPAGSQESSSETSDQEDSEDTPESEESTDDSGETTDEDSEEADDSEDITDEEKS